MRKRMVHKVYKQWDNENDKNNKLRLTREWNQIKSYIPEEYHAYISYSEEREILGA